MDLTAPVDSSRVATSIRLRHALETGSLSGAVADVFSERQMQMQSPAVDASLQLLELVGVGKPDATSSIRDHLQEHVRGRILLLARNELGAFVSALAEAPVVESLRVLLIEALKRLDPTNEADRQQLIIALGSPSALANVPPDAIAYHPNSKQHMPVAHVQAIWHLLPARCSLDIAYLLHCYDEATQLGFLGLNLMDTLAPSIAYHNEAIKRRGWPLMLRIFHIIRGQPELYRRVCDAIASAFECTRDVKWATLRHDLFIMHRDRRANEDLKLDASVVHAGTMAGKGAASRLSTPSDPLADLFFEGESLMQTLKGSMRKYADIARKLLEEPQKEAQVAPIPKAAVFSSSRSVQEQLTSVAQQLYNRADDVSIKGGTVTAAIFKEPVIEMTPGIKSVYLAAVKEPMDLHTMRTKAKNGQYRSFDDLRSDLELIEHNCKAFNAGNEQVLKPYLAVMKKLHSRLDDLIAAELALSSKAEQAASTASFAAGRPAQLPPHSRDQPVPIMQMLMAMVEPSLTRQVVHIVVAGIAASVREGVPLSSRPETLAALTILAAGDVAWARPGKKRGGLALAPPKAGSVEYYEQCASAVREILAPTGAAAPGRPALPLTIMAGISALRTAFVEFMMLRAGIPLPPVDAGVGGAGGTLRPALRALHALGRGRTTHGRSLSLLCVAVAACGARKDAGDPPPPHTPDAVAYMIDLASTASGVGPEECQQGVDSSISAGVSTRPKASIPADPCLLPTMLSHTEKILKGLDRSAALIPIRAALMTSVAERLALPALACARNAAHARGCGHARMAHFLKVLAVPSSAEGTPLLAPFEAAKLAHRALCLAAPAAEGEAVANAGRAVAALPGLLEAGYVQPLALVWIRPDFSAARRGYVDLIRRLGPSLPVPFDWASLGLNPYTAGVEWVGGCAAGGAGSGAALPSSTPVTGTFETLYTPVTPGDLLHTPGMSPTATTTGMSPSPDQPSSPMSSQGARGDTSDGDGETAGSSSIAVGAGQGRTYGGPGSFSPVQPGPDHSTGPERGGAAAADVNME